MAEEKKSLPKFPNSKWWALRRQLKRSFQTGALSANYLASVLDVDEKSTPAYMSPLRTMGLVDEAGKLTPRANDWRSDDKYARVCEEIVAEVYPSELRELQPGPDPDKAKVQRWIMSHLSIGEGAARQMAGMYSLLLEGDTAGGEAETPAKPAVDRKPSPMPKSAKPETTGQAAQKPAEQPAQHSVQRPTVHLDVQIHISPDASQEQIEKIFESMGKHIFGGSQGS